ncbi:MAG: hypothetical protein ACTSQY_02180 [Candidatus Odinarchaeia archaeon]
MSEEELENYKDALRKISELVTKIKEITLDKYPDLLKEKSLKERIKEIDTVQKRIDDLMIQFKKLFTEKLLVLTAMRSLLWHIKTTISDSEDTKEVKDRIRIFILPELERFLNSFKRETNLLENRIKPILDYFRDIQESVDSTSDKVNDFNTLTGLTSDKKISNLEEMLNLILKGELEEFNKKYEEIPK